MKTFWLSFAEADGKTARVYLLDATDEILARVMAHQRKLYRPGDQLLIIEVPPTEAEHALPRNRWLTEEELRSVDAAKLGDVDPSVS